MALLLSRKRDLAYFGFFVLHIPIMLSLDLVPLLPPSLVLPFQSSLQVWYSTVMKDGFWSDDRPAWFSTYLWMELLLHVPISAWAIGAILRDDPYVSLVLLPFSVQMAVTSVTCVAEMLTWPLSTPELVNVGAGYVAYAALAFFMAADMFLRLRDQLRTSRAVNPGRKTA